MNLPDYQKFVNEWWKGRRGNPTEMYSEDSLATDSLRDYFIMSVGLGGETGEVLELLKKHVRNGKIDREDLALELGDVLYYLTAIALAHGFTLEQLMQKNYDKLMDRAKNGKK